MEREESTLRFRGDDSDVTVTVLTPRIVRVRLGGATPTIPSYLPDREWEPAPFRRLDGEPHRVATSDLQIEVASAPLRLTFLDSRGEWLLREPADGGMSSELVASSGRRRLRACLSFSGEQHFYGLGQGGGELDRLGVTRQLWNTQLGHGPGSDLGDELREIRRRAAREPARRPRLGEGRRGEQERKQRRRAEGHHPTRL